MSVKLTLSAVQSLSNDFTKSAWSASLRCLEFFSISVRDMALNKTSMNNSPSSRIEMFLSTTMLAIIGITCFFSNLEVRFSDCPSSHLSMRETSRRLSVCPS